MSHQPGSDNQTSLIGLTLPTQHTTFDGSLYGNLHLIIEHQKKKKTTLSGPAKDSNYTINVLSEARMVPQAPVRAGGGFSRQL